jgi:lysophospholipase L1-like esterase
MKTLVCHGDSLTAPDELEHRSIWPSLVENRLKISVINSGIGGDTSGGLLSRFYPAVVQHRPDVALIMGGTNDLWWDLDIKMILANIFTMTCQAEHHDIVPLVGLPIPMVVEKACQQEFAAPEGGYDRCVEKLAALAKALARAAKQNDIACLDFYQTFCDKSGNANGKYFLDDGLHPNEAGHHLMAEITVKMLIDRFNFT